MEIKYFWRSLPGSTTLLMGGWWNGCLWKCFFTSYSHINTDFFSLFIGSWNWYLLSSIRLKKKKRNFQNQSFPFLNNISRPEMNFIPGETFYSYTNLQIHTIKKTLIFTRRQVVLVVMAFVNIIFRSFISIKPRQDFNPTAATFSLLLLVVWWL